MEADHQPTKAFSVRCTKERREGSTHSYTHLKPLSSYSKKIMYDNTKGRPSQFGGNLAASFCNIKIEIINNRVTLRTKRQLDNDSLDESNPTLRKKCFALSSSSPDLPSVWDSCGSLVGKGQAPKSSSEPKKTPQRLTMIRKAGRGLTVERHVPCPVPIQDGHLPVPSRDEADAKTGSTGVAQPPPCPKSLAPLQDCHLVNFDIKHAFDFNINDILSLSPIKSSKDEDDSEGIESFIDSCQSFYENSTLHTMGDTQGATGGRVKEEEEEEVVGGESRKEMVSLDKGYFSRSYHKALKKRSEGDDTSDFSPLQPSGVSTPALPAQASPSREQVAMVDGALRDPAPADEPVVCKNLLLYLDDVPVSHTVEGQPLLPKSAGALQGTGGGEEQEGNSNAVLPAQVRSVVVVPQKRANGSDTKIQSGLKLIKRPVVFDKEADWQREKRLYMDAVSNHIADSTPSGGGVLKELVSLMRTVATQGVSDGKKPWQHPSDLTRRNYKGQASKPNLSLDEWQQQNSRFHCRFANVPLTFQRSPVP